MTRRDDPVTNIAYVDAVVKGVLSALYLYGPDPDQMTFDGMPEPSTEDGALTPSVVLVLLVLRQHTDASGSTFVSYDRVARESLLSKSTVKSVGKALARLGVIRRVRTPGRNTYTTQMTLPPWALAALAEDRGWTPQTLAAVIASLKRRNQHLPVPVIDLGSVVDPRSDGDNSNLGSTDDTSRVNWLEGEGVLRTPSTAAAAPAAQAAAVEGKNLTSAVQEEPSFAEEAVAALARAIDAQRLKDEADRLARIAADEAAGKARAQAYLDSLGLDPAQVLKEAASGGAPDEEQDGPR